MVEITFMKRMVGITLRDRVRFETITLELLVGNTNYEQNHLPQKKSEKTRGMNRRNENY